MAVVQTKSRQPCICKCLPSNFLRLMTTPVAASRKPSRITIHEVGLLRMPIQETENLMQVNNRAWPGAPFLASSMSGIASVSRVNAHPFQHVR